MHWKESCRTFFYPRSVCYVLCDLRNSYFRIWEICVQQLFCGLANFMFGNRGDLPLCEHWCKGSPPHLLFVLMCAWMNDSFSSAYDHIFEVEVYASYMRPIFSCLIPLMLNKYLTGHIWLFIWFLICGLSFLGLYNTVLSFSFLCVCFFFGGEENVAEWIS